MNNLANCIPISEVSKLLHRNGFQTLEHICQETDLPNMYILLKCYLNGIEAGTNVKRNFSLRFILDQISNSNLDVVCKVLKCALQIQDTDDELVKLYEEYSSLTSKPVCLETLKIVGVLLEIGPGNSSLLSAYLNHTFNDIDEYKHFTTNMLPFFISNDLTSLNLVWQKCCVESSLSLLTTIPTSCFLSETWIDIIKQDLFWMLLNDELTANEGFKHKNAMYLFKVSVNILRNQNQKLENKYINEELLKPENKSFEYFCILIDTAREKQLHLIEPSLHLLNKLSMPPTWLNFIYKKLLCHPQTTVALKTLIYFMNSCIQNNLEVGSMFAALNKNEDSEGIFNSLQMFCKQLKEDEYESFVLQSLTISWNPIACFKFYKNSLIRPLSLDITLDIIKKCKKIPHKYIRQGLMYLIFSKVKNDLTEEARITKYMDVIIEFMLDDIYYKYATKLINADYLIVSNECIKHLIGILHDPNAKNLKTKVDFLIQVTERKKVPNTFVTSLYQDFKNRAYCNVVLDRLSYLYLIKATDLQEYLLERLETTEDSYSIRHMDKPNYELISKSISILMSNTHSNQQLLAYEVLFFMTKSNYNMVYDHWFNKILTEKQIAPNLASNFITLLIRIPSGFGRQNFHRLLQVYQEFFNYQRDDVLVQIYRNLDFILENADERNLGFLEIAFSKLFFLKSRDDAENSIRYLVRSIALNYKVLNKCILKFLLRKLYYASKVESVADLVIYYTTMYFKYLNFDTGLFPMYEFLLYPSNVLSKYERAEYDICRDIYLDLHTPNPSFRASEIRKWVLEDLLFDLQADKIWQSVNYLLEHYRKTLNKRYFPDSTLHLHKLRTMQILIFLLPGICINSLQKESLVSFLMDSFLVESHQPSVRILMQYLLVNLLKEEQSALEKLLKAVDTSNKTRTSTITGFLPVIYGLDLMNNNPEFSQKVIESVLVWTMGPHFKLRYYAQKLIREICQKHQHNFKFRKYDAILKAVDYSVKATTIKHDLDFEVMDYVYQSKSWRDHKKLIYLVTVYIPELCNVTAYEWEYFKIKNYWSKYKTENLTKSQISDVISLENVLLESTDNIQKKILPWQEAMENDQKVSKTTSKLIVVTSLIDSAANLGGLSRTCEIFGAQLLVVDNAKVVEKKDFTTLSMTSEKWLNITEVKSENLPEFLRKCREDGYKIIGIEQTSESSSLDTYKFQDNIVLLLGNERAGLPAPLIGLMDDCVEIPQFGMIRSLNVHVAGALVIWEYTKQQMMTAKVK